MLDILKVGLSTLAPYCLAWLLDYTARGSVLLLLAWLVTRIMRPYGPSVHHAIWVAALMGILVMPFLSSLMPTWRVPLPLLPSGIKTEIYTPAILDVPEQLLPPELSAKSGQEPAQSSVRASKDELSISTGLVTIWLFGILILCGQAAAGSIYRRRLARSGSAIVDSSISGLFDHLRYQAGVRRPVSLLISDGILIPMTWGLLRPTILLPSESFQWPEAQKRQVMLHELAHIRRLDVLTQRLALVVAIFHWFNPLVWKAFHQILLQREHSCDAFVLDRGCKASDYASVLLEIARRACPPRRMAWAGLTMARPSQLEGRLFAILQSGAERARTGPVRTGMLILLALVMIAALSALDFARNGREPDQPDPAPAGEMIEAGSDSMSKIARMSEAVPSAVEFAPSMIMSDKSASAIETLRSLLRDPERARRLKALRSLAKMGSAAAIEAMAPALKDENREVRSKLIDLLVPLKDSSAQSLLVRALQDPNKDLRKKAIEALVKRKKRDALEPIGRLIADENWEVRKKAAWAAGELGNRSALPLLALSLQDSHHKVRVEAVEALEELEDEAALPYLQRAMADQDWEVREAAINALKEIKGAAAIDLLMRTLNHEQSAMRREALDALVDLKYRRAVPDIILLLNDSDNKVRAKAAWALGELNNHQAVEPLIHSLADADWRVRKAAAESLGDLKDLRALTALRAKRDDRNKDVREQVDDAIREIEDKK